MIEKAIFFNPFTSRQYCKKDFYRAKLKWPDIVTRHPVRFFGGAIITLIRYWTIALDFTYSANVMEFRRRTCSPFRSLSKGINHGYPAWRIQGSLKESKELFCTKIIYHTILCCSHQLRHCILMRVVTAWDLKLLLQKSMILGVAKLPPYLFEGEGCSPKLEF